MSEAKSESASANRLRDDQVQVAKGAGLTGIGAVLEGVLRYVSMLLVTQNYGRQAYGVFGFVMMLNEMGQRVSSAGLHDGVMRNVAVHEADGETNKTRGAILFAGKLIVGIGVLYALGLALFADQVAELLDKGEAKDVPKDVVARVVMISCLALPTTALIMLMGRTLRALKEVGLQVIVRSFLQPISRVALILLFLFLLGNENMEGLAWAIVLSAAFCCAVGVWFVHKRVGLFGKSNSNEIDKQAFLKFAMPLVGVDILTFFSLSADIFLLGDMGSQGELGSYMAVVRLMPILALPLFLFSSLLTPLSAELYGQKRMDDLRQLYRTSVRWIFAVSLPFTLTGVIWAEPILGHLGEGFEEGASAFVVIALTLVLTGFANPAGYAVTMAGYSRITLMNSAVMLVTVAGLGWWLIPQYGILGAAIARAGANLANCILTLTEGYIILGLNPLHGALIKPAIAAPIAAAGAWGLLHADILNYTLGGAVLGGMVMSLIYTILMAMLGLNDEDKHVLLAGSKPLHGVAKKVGRLIGR